MKPCSLSILLLLLIGASAPRCPAEVAYESRPAGEWERMVRPSLEFAQLDVKAEEVTGLPYRSYYIDPNLLVSDGLAEATKPFSLSYLMRKGDTLLGSIQLDPNLESVDSFEGNDGMAAAFWAAIQLS